MIDNPFYIPESEELSPRGQLIRHCQNTEIDLLQIIHEEGKTAINELSEDRCSTILMTLEDRNW